MNKTFALPIISILMLTTYGLASQNWPWAVAVGDTTGNTSINSLSGYQRSGIILAGGFEDKTLNLGYINLENNGRSDAFVALCDMDGNFLWAEGFGGIGDDKAIAAASDDEGNIYLAGNYKSLSFSAGDTSILNRGESDGFLIKINPAREVEWAFSIGGLPAEEITGLAADEQGNIYISGHSIDFSSQQFNIFLYKLDTYMNVIWQQKIISDSWDTRSGALAIDVHGNCYIGGSFSGEMNLGKDHILISSKAGDPPWEYYETNAFIIKYDTDGEVLKALSEPGFAKINALAVHGDQIYSAAEKINFGIGWGWPLADSKIFVSKYDNQLDRLWIRTAGGETELQSLDIAVDIDVDGEGNVYVTGSFFSKNIEFAGDILENVFHKDYFYQQVFVLKYDAYGNEIWGIATGQKLNDAGNSILVFSADRLITAGVFESSEIYFGDKVLKNNGFVHEIYVHLKPKRQGRNMISFLAMLDKSVSVSDQDDHSMMPVLYPNPARDHFWILISQEKKNSSEVSIFSEDGRLVKTLYFPVGAQELYISTDELDRGIYFVKLKSENHVLVKKLVRI